MKQSNNSLRTDNRLTFTAHARIRKQQRAVPDWLIDMLQTDGKTAYDGHRGRIVFFPSRTRSRLLRERPWLRAHADKLNAYLCLAAEENVVITVGRRSKRIINR